MLDRLTSRLSLQQLFFLLLVFSGIIPLIIISQLVIGRNRELLETQEKTTLTRSARSLSVELSDYVSWNRKQLHQLGAALAGAPGPEGLEERLRQPWVPRYLQDFMADNPQLLALRILDDKGGGPTLAPSDLPAPVADALMSAYEGARREGRHFYSFARLPDSDQPVVAVAVPIARSDPQLYVEGVLILRLVESVFVREAQSDVAVFLISRTGNLLWSAGADRETQRALMESPPARDFMRKPLNLTVEYKLFVDGQEHEMVGQVSPVAETGWGVVGHKPVSAAFAAARHMVWSTVLSTLVLVLLSMTIAALAARLMSRPIQELAVTTRQIAAGNYQQRAEVKGAAAEIRQLSDSFNRMSSQVERNIGQIRRAARANRELFINSIRAFAAAIDAKDPYTRGHSERVANISRTISRAMELPSETQHKVWVGALLHDVGKIGIDDRILGKGGLLTPEEYEHMKLHTVIGAEILSPIDQLRDMLPAVRWHHESWDGSGYPDGLHGEEIPLIARIVSVADSFDAITVSRPYQRFRPIDDAVEVIRDLVGTRFDGRVVDAFLTAYAEGEIRVDQAGAAARAPAPAATDVEATAEVDTVA